MGLKLVTAPSVEPLTTAEVKLYTRILGTAEDATISKWIAAGRIWAENIQGRAYITQTWDLSTSYFPTRSFLLPRPVLQSVTSIKYYDQDNTEYTFSSDNYLVDISSEIGCITLKENVYWPNVTLKGAGGFVCRFVAGYGDTSASVPETVKDALLLYCSYRCENRSGEVEKVPQFFVDMLEHDRMRVLDNV